MVKMSHKKILIPISVTLFQDSLRLTQTNQCTRGVG